MFIQYQPADRYIIYELAVAINNEYHIGGRGIGIEAAQVLYGLPYCPFLAYGGEVGIDEARHALLGIAQQVVGSEPVLIIEQIQVFGHLYTIEHIKEGDTVIGFEAIEYVGYVLAGQFFNDAHLQRMIEIRKYFYLYRFG